MLVHIHIVKTRPSMTQDQHKRIFSIPLNTYRHIQHIKHYIYQNIEIRGVGTLKRHQYAGLH